MKLNIPKIEANTENLKEISERLSKLPSNKIDIANWEQYMPKPDVSFRIAHNGDNILMQYNVHENEILGIITEDNGKVWTDSCVEFFVSFDGLSYYNVEATCVGRVLLGWRKNGEKSIHGEPKIMKKLKRLSSLGEANKEKQSGDFKWSLTLAIPTSAFWMSEIKTFDGMKARANFYKCGDNLTVPHFLSWNKIDTPKPNFHQPSFFGDLEFE